MKTVLITGSNRGIGMETALAFARAGHIVFATVRSIEKAADFKQLIKDEFLPINIYQMDVDSDESVKKCVNKITQEHGNIDVLINNAGIERHGSVEELSIEDFKSVMETNYFGALRCSKAVLKAMRQNNRGCIINISSVAGKIACTPFGAYSASKFALEATTEILAQEVKPYNIRVALIEPGIIATEMSYAIAKKNDSLYPQVRRFGNLFTATLKTPTPSAMVAEKILEVVESGTWQLRHAIGPDAEPFLSWRLSMKDEEWLEWNSQEDEAWYDAVESTFGMNCRPERLQKEK